jgi:hypothetical protein
MIDNDSYPKVGTNLDSNSSRQFASIPRWWWIALMAACLMGLGTKVSASDPVTSASAIQLDAILPGPIDEAGPIQKSLATNVANAAPSQSGRPTMVDFSAHLANFDRDADADGWLTAIALRDTSGNIVTARSYATFELKVGRFAMDQITFVSADRVAHRWSENLQFDDDGVARVRLTLPRTAKSRSGLTMYPATPNGTRPMYTSGTVFPIQRLSSADRFRYTPTNGLIGLDLPFVPALGALSVRVSVPTVGTLDGVTIVRLNSSVIDSQ